SESVDRSQAVNISQRIERHLGTHVPRAATRRNRTPGCGHARAGNDREIYVHAGAAIQSLLPPLSHHLGRESGPEAVLHSRCRSCARVAGQGSGSHGHRSPPPHVTAYELSNVGMSTEHCQMHLSDYLTTELPIWAIGQSV